MPIDDDDLKHLEESLVHDEDDEPQPEGWGIYATPKFLARVTLIAYAIMIAFVLGALCYSGSHIPVIFMPGSLVVALPFALVGLYLNWVSESESVLAKKRTTQGRLVAGFAVWFVLQAATVLIWLGIVRAFSLR
jgi:hypothetical protein